MGGMSQVIYLALTQFIHCHMFRCFLCAYYLRLLQDFLNDDFKSQGSHIPYNGAEFSTQVLDQQVCCLVEADFVIRWNWLTILV